MSTLSIRLEWILSEVRAPDGSRWTQRKLSTAAGLAPGHVAKLREGLLRPSVPTLEAIAKAAGVSFAWLAVGEGDPFGDFTRELSVTRGAVTVTPFVLVLKDDPKA